MSRPACCARWSSPAASTRPSASQRSDLIPAGWSVGTATGRCCAGSYVLEVGMGSMDMAQRPALAFDRSLVRRGVSLMAIGTTLFVVGSMVGGVALLGAFRRYLNQTEERPTEAARR